MQDWWYLGWESTCGCLDKVQSRECLLGSFRTPDLDLSFFAALWLFTSLCKANGLTKCVFLLYYYFFGGGGWEYLSLLSFLFFSHLEIWTASARERGFTQSQMTQGEERRHRTVSPWEQMIIPAQPMICFLLCSSDSSDSDFQNKLVHPRKKNANLRFDN